MARLSRTHFPPSFFDLPTRTGRGVPGEIVERWVKGDRSAATARALLAPTVVRGTVVATDAAGLTRLTRRRGLVEMLALLDRPKELVHAYGCAVGGEGVGIWAADNTLMFYPEPAVRCEAVARMLLALRDELAAECELSIGAAAHYGAFYRLGDSLLGADAEAAEEVAESETEGGEVVLTAAFVERLRAEHEEEEGDGGGALPFALERRGRAGGGVETYRLLDGPRPSSGTPLAAGADANFAYPIPYSAEFHAEMRRCRDAVRGRGDGGVAPEVLEQRFAAERAVVLVEREREQAAPSDAPEAVLLDELALTVAMRRVGDELLARLGYSSGGETVKTAGRVGIYVFADCDAAVAFARRFRAALAEQGIASRVGVDVGPVLLFDLDGDGTRDIAGTPVNLASKLAQDRGAMGRIYLTADAHARLRGGPQRDGWRPVRFEASGVVIEGWEG